jgi:hypothetical protein
MEEEEGLEEIVAKDVGHLLKLCQAFAIASTCPRPIPRPNKQGQVNRPEIIELEDAAGEPQFILELRPNHSLNPGGGERGILGMLSDMEVEEVDEGGEGLGVGFIEKDRIVGTKRALHRFGVDDNLVVEMEGVDQLVDQDFEMLFPAEEDDLAVLVSLLFGRLQESNSTVYLFGT